MSQIVGSLKDYFSTHGKEKLKEKIKGLIIGGLELYFAKDIIPRYIKQYTYKYIDRNLMEHTPIGEKIAPALVLQMIIPEEYEDTVISDIVDMYAIVGVEEELTNIVDKQLICVSVDEKTIKCKNYTDLSNAVVIIDGVEKKKDTDYTVNNDTINLSTALTSGEHTLIVIDGGKEKVFYGKIYV